MIESHTSMEMMNNAKNLEKDEKIRQELIRRAAREEAKRKAQKIKEGKRKVLSIVESIVDEKVDQETLIDLCKYLCKQDYEDVNVERSLVNICGYPLCFADLPKPAGQRYHISLADHKVYDLSERKLFCSNLCYKASCYLKEQLDDEPFWMRNGQKDEAIPSVHVEIYQDTKGARGEEVLIVPRVETDVENITTGSGDIETDEDEDEFNFLEKEMRKSEKESKRKEQAKLKSTFVASPYIKERDLTKFAESMNKLTIKERSND